MVPSTLQALCVSLDFYLAAKLPNGMPRNYIIFALVRSLIRAYAQWFCSVETWQLVYWWGELLGYLVVIVLISGITHKLLAEHVNTATFYSLVALFTVALTIWHLPTHPLSLGSLLVAGNIARAAMGFLLLMALVLGEKWDPMAKWLAFGVVINLGTQTVGGWYEGMLGPTLMVSLVHQLGYLCLQLSWIIGVNRSRVEPMPIHAITL